MPKTSIRRISLSTQFKFLPHYYTYFPQIFNPSMHFSNLKSSVTSTNKCVKAVNMFHFTNILGKCVEELFGVNDCGRTNMSTKSYVVENGMYDYIQSRNLQKPSNLVLLVIFSKLAYKILLMFIRSNIKKCSNTSLINLLDFVKDLKLPGQASPIQLVYQVTKKSLNKF